MRSDQIIVLTKGSLAHLLLQVVDVLLDLLVHSLSLAELEVSILSALLTVHLLARQTREIVVDRALSAS